LSHLIIKITIIKIMLKHIFSNSFKELKESEAFQIGVKDYKEGKLKDRMLGIVKSLWIKKLVAQREWDSFYKYNASYCNLGKVGGAKDSEGNTRGGKVKMGFVIVGEVPQSCELCTDEEIMQIDDYRRANNIYPRPLKEIKREEM